MTIHYERAGVLERPNVYIASLIVHHATTQDESEEQASQISGSERQLQYLEQGRIYIAAKEIGKLMLKPAQNRFSLVPR